MNTKVGLIRCQQTEDYCPSDICMEFGREGKGGFEETGPVEIMGVVTCGGCPGKKAIKRAAMMKERGAEMIAFASCIQKGAPGDVDYPCPFGKKMQNLIEDKNEMEVIEWTH